VLLAVLDAGAGSVETAALAARLGLAPSALLRQLLPLEKTGLAARQAGANGARCVVLRAGGRRVVREARATAEATCAEEGEQAALSRQPASFSRP
jgi:DNA-binding MarR family transcriptional regulator